MAELFAFDKETMYFWWNIKKCRSIVGSGRSFCIGGVFCYSVRFGLMYECEELLGSVYWFEQKLSIRYIVTSLINFGANILNQVSWSNNKQGFSRWYIFHLILIVWLCYKGQNIMFLWSFYVDLKTMPAIFILAWKWKLSQLFRKWWLFDCFG